MGANALVGSTITGFWGLAKAYPNDIPAPIIPLSLTCAIFATMGIAMRVLTDDELSGFTLATVLGSLGPIFGWLAIQEDAPLSFPVEWSILTGSAIVTSVSSAYFFSRCQKAWRKCTSTTQPMIIEATN